MSQQFKAGDTVKLKSSGPVMTTVEHGSFSMGAVDGYKCRWFDDKNKVTEAVFTEANWMYFDDETGRLEPTDNPFGSKLLPMPPE